MRYFYKITDYISENPSERVFFMMKKLFVLLLAVLFTVSFVACNREDVSDPKGSYSEDLEALLADIYAVGGYSDMLTSMLEAPESTEDMFYTSLITVEITAENEMGFLGANGIPYERAIASEPTMMPTRYSLCLLKVKEGDKVKQGDIITYMSQNSDSFGETITHKIRSLTTDAAGNPGFITYGTTTDTDDETVVTYPYILGKYEKAIPNLGNFFMFLKTPQGYIFCIFIPFMLLILYQGINCVKLFRRYKKEQMEELETERAQIEKERAESAKMMEELMALKAQLEQQKVAATTEEVTANENISED